MSVPPLSHHTIIIAPPLLNWPYIQHFYQRGCLASYASAGIAADISVCPSVRPSVPPVTLWYCILVSSPTESLNTLVLQLSGSSRNSKGIRALIVTFALSSKVSDSQILPVYAPSQLCKYHHHHHHHKTGLTWCKHSSDSGPCYKVSVTHVASVRKSWKTDTSSTQYGMMSR